jgi:hypothetical protein
LGFLICLLFVLSLMIERHWLNSRAIQSGRG